MKRFVTILLATICSAFSSESQVDFRVDTDPTNLHNKTSFNISSTNATVTANQKHAFLVTPEMTFYTNGSIDFSVTATHRHLWRNIVFGHNIFFDRSKISCLSLDQIGTGIDLQTQRFDIRANYYYPITNYIYYAAKACRWIDTEIFFKTRHFGVGTGPLYNLDMQAWALHSRVVIPLKGFSVNFGGICGGGKYGQSQIIFSISFHIFKPNKSTPLISPPCHVQKSNIYYNSSYNYDIASDKFPLKFKLDYNNNLLPYIEQIEEDITLQDKEHNS